MDLPTRNIRFTSTEDGVDIAFWEIGEGEPVVLIHNFGLSHAELEWGVLSLASFYMDMAERYRVIRFDPRGIGLSGEPPGGWGATTPSGAQQGMSTVEMGLDISAVAAVLELNSFALMGSSVQSPVAIAYAATHSHVSELILCDAMANIADGWLGPLLHTEMGLEKLEEQAGRTIFTNWERVGLPEELPQLLKAVYDRSSSYRPGLAELTQLEWDAESLLADVSVPTLILAGRNTSLVDRLPDARHLAAGIKGSELCGLEGDDRSFSPYLTDRMATLEAIDAFLKPERIRTTPGPSGFRTVVFTDVVGSTEYVRRVGDEQGRTTIRELEEQAASLAKDHGGRVVKNLGDGSLVSFGSNSSAISFAIDLQHACAAGPLDLRIGMAAGEPIQEDGDIHGTVVTQASRISDLGAAGEVMVSDFVRQLAAGKGFTFEPRGEVSLKGFDVDQQVWKVIRNAVQ